MAVRSESSRRAILDATLSLLGDQPPGPVTLQKLSIERIAREAGVSKMTIYRWWPNKAALVIETFLDNHIAQTAVPDEGRALDALRVHLASLAKVYDGPEGRLMTQLIAECQYDPATLHEFKTRFREGRAAAVAQLIQRAIDEGDLRSDVTPDEVAEILYAPIYFRLLFRNAPLNADATDRLFEVALAGLAATRTHRVADARSADRRVRSTRESA
ncbi:TetR/AcrR family transcriptional regulator [Cryptosporangium phraense]|uniref:TetR/AcrR family transcriptional regulator n=1 Tax=Cryptosporangium phraense TaxID=2593070 RepID=A0A545AUV6_9ACTN|nr:TetR/AcrR family transcriptional regulator [Cryptosporangium phraense]TQS45117.1 TetR/AcrR family transcriptional regulator [Cryptosporangium phraense]